MWRSEALKVLGCSWNTLRRYVKTGVIRYTDLPNGKRMYWDDDVYAVVGKRLTRGHDVVVYSRVNGKSEEDQKKMAEQQRFIYEWCVARGITIEKVYEDWCPSTEFSHEKRPGLHALLQSVFKKEIFAIVIESTDRIARVGWEMFKEIFKYYGVQFIIINKGYRDPYYQKEQEEDLALILKKAGVERLDALAGNILPTPNNEKLPHPGKWVPDWEGAPPGIIYPEGGKPEARLYVSHFRRMKERPQGGESPVWNPEEVEERRKALDKKKLERLEKKAKATKETKKTKETLDSIDSEDSKTDNQSRESDSNLADLI